MSPGNLGCCLQLLVLTCNLANLSGYRAADDDASPLAVDASFEKWARLLSLPEPRCAVEIATSRGQAQQEGDEDPQRLLEANTLLPHESRKGDDVLG